MLQIKNNWATKFMSEEKIKWLNDFYNSIEETLTNKGYKVKAGEIFDSGYQGCTFHINGIKCILIYQGGVVGLEDQRPGYIELLINGKSKKVITHKERGFGDVTLNESELNYAFDNIHEYVLDLLTELKMNP